MLEFDSSNQCQHDNKKEEPSGSSFKICVYYYLASKGFRNRV